jgi:hypothetical protein
VNHLNFGYAVRVGLLLADHVTQTLDERAGGADAQRPGEGAFPRSPRDLPRRDDLAGGGVFGVFQRDAHRGKFVADAICLGPILGFARRETGRN